MSLRDGIPVVECRPRQEAVRFTGLDAVAHSSPIEEHKAASTAFVSSEGVVRLPVRIMRNLGIEQGGGVVFMMNKRTGHVEILTDAQSLNDCWT